MDYFMLKENYTIQLLGLEGLEVINVVNKTFTLRLPVKPHVCPECGAVTTKIHDYRLQKIKHIPIPGSPYTIFIKKRRYVCPNCGKKIPEKNNLLPKYRSVTTNLQKQILYNCTNLLNMKQISNICNVSPSTVARTIENIKYRHIYKFPAIISIDEFKGNAGGYKFQCIITDPQKKKILDILPNRNSEDIYNYLTNTDIKERLKVKYVIMDMSSQFRSIMTRCFPEAKVITDKFHTVRLANWAIEYVRKQEQKKFTDIRRRYFKKSRFILLKRKRYLGKEEKEQLANMLKIAPRLKKAYVLKELFYKVMDSKTEEQFNKRLSKWFMLVESYNIDKFLTMAQSVRKWIHPIRRAVLTGYTNGYTEGCNNRTKVLKRICFGVRNFNRFRNRLLFIANYEKKAG